MNQKKIHLISLGCKKNQIDSEVVLGSLLTKGYQLAENEADADVVFINTCSFINDAQKESRDVINEVLALKEQGKTIVLVEHNMELVRSLSDHIIVMDSGKLLAQGKPDEVLSRRDVVEAYLGE
jgi:tRNA A37 methylthiotransferase MiaB